MIFVFIALFMAEWGALIMLWAPFGVLAFLEMARANWKQEKRGLARYDAPDDTRMTRWHVVAAVLVIGSALILLPPFAFDILMGDDAWEEVLEELVILLIEGSLWFVALSALFGPMYAVRLHRQRVHAAELIGLGVLLLPATLMTLRPFDTAADPESLFAFGIAGAVLFPLGIAVPVLRVKTLILAVSCVLMIIALTDWVGVSNPLWLLAGIAMGYTLFRAEWNGLAGAARGTVQASAPAAEALDAVGISPQGRLTASTVRTVTFLVVNIACALAIWAVWRIGFGADGIAPAAVFAMIAIVIASTGAALTTLTPIAFGHSRSGIDHAAATFVVLLTVASVMHLVSAPTVVGFDMDESAMVQNWKPVLGIFAGISAFGIALTTLTGRLCPLRPFMATTVLPTVFLLPSDSFFTLIRDDTFIVWVQRLMETGIAVTILGIMWYAFGPGRRTAPSREVPTNRKTTEATVEAVSA